MLPLSINGACDQRLPKTMPPISPTGRPCQYWGRGTHKCWLFGNFWLLLFANSSRSLSYAAAGASCDSGNTDDLDWAQIEREEQEYWDQLVGLQESQTGTPPASGSDDKQAAPNKNRSAMRTWVLCLNLFLSDGMLFANLSIWELNYYQWKVRQVITTFKWKMSGRILFTYFIFISDNNLSLLCKKAYMGNPTLQILHSEGKFWN